MEERIRPTKSGLFAIELLIGVGVFAICAAICVGLFVRAEVVSHESADMTQAVNEARSAAECFKASGGDLARTAEQCGGDIVQGAMFLHYDEHWQRLPYEGDWTFQLTLAPHAAEGYAAGTLSVDRAAEDAPFLSWEVAAMEVRP